VLVTGACGTVGGALCRKVRRFAPAALCLVDKDGRGLERLAADLAGGPGGGRVSLVEADVRDADRVDAVIGEARPQLVFHAAGVHSLSAVEDDPCRGVADNVLGTRNVVDAAVRHGVRRFVLASSVRAAEPTSVLGATMRLGELLLRTATGGPTCFAAVRIGDVIGGPGIGEPRSGEQGAAGPGSGEPRGGGPGDGEQGPPTGVLGSIARRIAAGEVVTIAHPEAARHVMT